MGETFFYPTNETTKNDVIARLMSCWAYTDGCVKTEHFDRICELDSHKAVLKADKAESCNHMLQIRVLRRVGNAKNHNRSYVDWSTWSAFGELTYSQVVRIRDMTGWGFLFWKSESELAKLSEKGDLIASRLHEFADRFGLGLGGWDWDQKNGRMLKMIFWCGCQAAIEIFPLKPEPYAKFNGRSVGNEGDMHGVMYALRGTFQDWAAELFRKQILPDLGTKG